MQNKPLIITHRGDRTNRIENTISACELALENGATGIEVDIRACGSGEIVVFHDFSLKRMFNRPGYIGRLSIDELKKIPYSVILENIPAIPCFIDTLDAFLDRFKNTVPINLDAKTIHFFDFTFADKIAGIIRNHNVLDKVWISCFNPFLLQILKLKNKHIKTGYLFQRMSWMHTSYDLLTWSDAWHPHFSIVTESLVKKARSMDKELYVWTVNDAETFNLIQQFPLAGIITDDVPQISGFVKNANG